MEFSQPQKDKITNMITKGDKMEVIAKAIGGTCTWQDIQEFCWATGYMSWQGSKRMISSRLAKFKTASRQPDRVRLAKEIDDSASYLYYCAKEMRSRLVAVEKALRQIK